MHPSLPQPIGRQREVLYLPANGHTVVLGTAGSGKTTLAIHRAAHLADSSVDHGGATLLLTFNKCLVTYLNGVSGTIANVDVRNYHKFALGYLNTRGKMRYNAICNRDEKETFCRQAILQITNSIGQTPILDRPIQFIIDEFSWIAQNGIQTVDDYCEEKRIGRVGARAARADRPTLFSAYEAYLAIRASQDRLYDWEDVAQTVETEFAADNGARRYRHIVIDEGQDFSPVMLRSLVAAIPEDGSLTFFGDMAQQIYGNRLSWRTAGLSIAKVWRFTENYRNTKQIAHLALAIADTEHFRGTSEDLVEPTAPTADGPMPVLVRFPSTEAEIRFVAKLAQERAQTGTVAVLFRDRAAEGHFVPLLLSDATRLHKDMPQWSSEPQLYYGTFHAAKGLEFDTVIVPFASTRNLPHPPDTQAYGEDEAEARDAKLLYVAVTRAKASLVFTYHGTPTTILPRGNDLLKEAVL